jgi:hypothetical protein
LARFPGPAECANSGQRTLESSAFWRTLILIQISAGAKNVLWRVGWLDRVRLGLVDHIRRRTSRRTIPIEIPAGPRSRPVGRPIVAAAAFPGGWTNWKSESYSTSRPKQTP